MMHSVSKQFVGMAKAGTGIITNWPLSMHGITLKSNIIA